MGRGEELRTIVLNSFGEIAKESWEGLWRRDPRAHVYQSYEWYRAWEKNLASSGSTRLILVMRGDKLVGACPLCVVRQSRFGIFRRRALTFCSSLTPAFPLDQGPLLDPEFEEESYQLMADEALRFRDIAVALFELFVEGSRADRLLATIGNASGRSVRRWVLAKSHVVTLGATYEDFLQTLGGKTRRNIRNYHRRFIEGGARREIRLVRSSFEMLQLVAAMKAQKHVSFEVQGRKSNMDVRGFEGFLNDIGESLFKKGRAVGHCVYVDEQIVGTQLLFIDENGHAYAYNTSCEPGFLNMRLHYLLESARCEEAIVRGVKCIDLSTGFDHHKEHWSRGNTLTRYSGSILLNPVLNSFYWPIERLREARRSRGERDEERD